MPLNPAIDVPAVIAFHGHFCPGLATGIRLAEVALERYGARAGDEELVAIIETANCAADAIQFLLGCTYGKANLIHLDRGRNVYTFLRRSDGDALRLTCLSARDDMTEDQRALVGRIRAHTATPEDHAAYDALWEARGYAVLERPRGELFRIEKLTNYAMPPRAVVEPSVACDGCGALVMASRLTRVNGRLLCAACAPPRVSGGPTVTAIGVVRNELSSESAPRARSARSVLELAPEYAEGLLGLAVGQQVDVYFLFDRSPDAVPMLQHRRGDRSEPARGVFSLRSPVRPTPLGHTTVEVLEVLPGALVVEGLDAWDGSPILDIKPAMH